jgi:Na+/glutamate symporter
MPKRTSTTKSPYSIPTLDLNQIAAAITETATNPQNPTAIAINQAAATLGRLGGLKGGPARAKKLTSKKRTQIAKKAAKARWKKLRKP